MADEFQPDDFRDRQEDLYHLIDFPSGFADGETGNTVHDLFYHVMYDDELTDAQRLAYDEELSAYLYEVYGMEFWDLWDWDDFREWYDSV